MKDHLHQHIPQLLTEIFHILFVNRIRRLVSLLQHIHADGCMRLLTVPGTASGRPEQLHHGAEVGKIIAFFGQECGCFFVHDAPKILFL